MENLISLCDIELQLMVEEAKEHCDPSYVRINGLDDAAMDIGFSLGSQNIRLTPVTLSVLSNIEALSKDVYGAFVYAYNGTLRANHSSW